MDTEKNLREIAEQYGWNVWSFDNTLAAHTAFLETGRIIEHQVCYWLRSPLDVPFNDGLPCKAGKTEGSVDEIGFFPHAESYSVQVRHSEAEAWDDLPKTLEELMRYSSPAVPDFSNGPM